MTSPTSLPPAYLLWLGPTGLTIARSLGRAGVRVVGLHDDINEACVRTRYAEARILPSLHEDEHAWLEALLEEGRVIAPRRGVLIAASDAHWLFVARHREALARHFDFALPEGGDLSAWMGKPFQYAAAARVGVPFPATALPRTLDDVILATRRMTFPCLIKPVLSHLWQREFHSKLIFVRDADELIDRARQVLPHGLEFMLQEYIPATDDEIYGVFMALDRDSRPLGCCVSRKLRQNEPRFGNSCMSQCVDEPRAVELGLRLAQSMGFHGIGSAEFKRDPRDGQFKLMEFNVRPTLLMSVGVDSGVDLPLLSYRELIGEAAPEHVVTPRRFGRRIGIMAKDLHSARFYRQMGLLTRRAWLRSWIGARDTHFAWDDRRPFYCYANMMIDHWRRGMFKELPTTFPTQEEWRAGEWDGVRTPPAQPPTGEREREIAAAAA